MNTHVSYKTPFGRFNDWESAATACERADMDPVTCIAIEVSPSEIFVEHAYGSSFRLSTPIRCY